MIVLSPIVRKIEFRENMKGGEEKGDGSDRGIRVKGEVVKEMTRIR